jgi:hypothetical protein
MDHAKDFHDIPFGDIGVLSRTGSRCGEGFSGNIGSSIIQRELRGMSSRWR